MPTLIARSLTRHTDQNRRLKEDRPRGRKRGSLTGWLYFLPAALFLIGWQAYPVIRVTWLSFTDYHFARLGEPISWVGFDNYIRALGDPLVTTGLLRALIFTVIYVPGVLAIPLFAAILINRLTSKRAQGAYRLILLVPAMIPGPLIFVLWMWLLSASIGPINYILTDVLGVYDVYDVPRWLGQPHLVFPSIAVMHWWWGLGLHTIFFLAGLATIPQDLDDAARIDGASALQHFWHVTLPRLRPMILVLMILRFGNAMSVIEEYIIVGGLNRELPTYTWTVYMWETAFRLGDMNQSYASAIGWIGTLAQLAVVGAMFWFLRPQD